MPTDNLTSYYRGKRVLITGGMGFIGSNLAHGLVRLGARVEIADPMLSPYGGNAFNLHGIEDEIQVHHADIRNEAAMNRLVQEMTIIFNLAGQVSHNDSLERPFLDLSINCVGHLTVLEACRKHNPAVTILYPGSRLQYGRIRKLPVDEDHPMQPLSIYGVHKTTAEQYYVAYHRHYGMNTVCFRLTNPYGPRAQMKHPKYCMVNWFLRNAMEDQTITIFGEGKQVRDYIHVDDVVSAFLAAPLRKEASGEVFNLGSGVPTPFADMAQTIVRVTGKGRTEQVPWPSNYENVETGDFWADISKASKLLGWTPATPLEEGLRKTLAYYEAYRNHYW
jgi:UDP-glucose 4-epimerase